MKNMFKKVSFVLAVILIALTFTACSSSSEKKEANTFPKFTGEDLEGNKVTQEIFKKSPVTVVNLWFTGCKACIMEMPELQKKAEEWKTKGVNTIGICADIQGKEEVKNEAKKILDSKGVNYTNISIDSGEESDKFMMNITTFPTTLLVDRNGNIIGDPILGTIDNEKATEEINKRIDEIIAKDNK